MKREHMLAGGLIIAILILVSIVSFFKTNVDEGSARQFVLEDIKSRFPNADSEIIETNSMTNPEGKDYFSIKAKVTHNAQTACPLRTHYYYNYPVQNFIPAPPDQITTQDCRVCRENPCIIAFPEEAVIASHTSQGSEEIAAFIASHPQAVHSVAKTDAGFVVKWYDKTEGYEVTVARSGAISSIKSLPTR